MNDTYFAALSPDDLLPKLSEKISQYYDFANRYGFMTKWRKGYTSYYGMSESGADSAHLNQGGTNGDQYILRVNQYRSLIQSLLVMTTSQRPAWQPKAQNTDSQSLAQTVLARSILDFYMSDKHLERDLKKATEFALVAGEGFISLSWNATSGQIYAVGENNRPVYDGDVEFSVYHPIDVIRDTSGTNEKTAWYIIRSFKNKYDLAAKYFELEDDILSVSNAYDPTRSYANLSNSQSQSDFIPVYTFRHKESDSLPAGRQVEFIDGDVILNDGPLPYKSLSVFRIAPGEWHGTPFGYTPGYDLMGIQKNYDALNSIIATGQLSYGLQSILLPRGGNVNVVELAQGLNGIEYDHAVGKPEPLNLLHTPPEIFKQVENLEHLMQSLSGVNAVIRGTPEASLKSGSALALVAAQAVQSNSGLQSSYNSLLEDCGTGLIEFLQTFATTPRIMQIAGKSNRSRIQEFKGTDLEGISRVTVEVVNPMSKTAAGKMQMAQDLMNSKLITTPQEYLEVIMTGSLDALLEADTSEILLIRSENEDLADGKQPSATAVDRHSIHIKEHATCLASPEARANPTIVQNVTAHIQLHIDLLRNTDPAILQLMGETPLPPAPGANPPGPPPPSGPMQGPPMNATPTQPHASPANIPPNLNATHPVVEQASGVKGPRMPSLPSGTPDDLKNAYAQIKTQ